MSEEGVGQRLQEMRELTDDWEAVHSKEDKLLWEYVQIIAAGDISETDIYDVAEVLIRWREETKDQPRWCA